MNDDDLIQALEVAEGANVHGRGCQVCHALTSMSEQARDGVIRALSNSLVGERKLSEILTRSGYPTGRRAVRNHRLGGHDR